MSSQVKVTRCSRSTRVSAGSSSTKPVQSSQIGSGYACLGWLSAALLVAAIIALPAGPASAVVIIKADNANNLDQNTSWVGSVTPGSGDTAQWDSTWSGTYSSALGASLTWGNIKITNPQARPPSRLEPPREQRLR